MHDKSNEYYKLTCKSIISCISIDSIGESIAVHDVLKGLDVRLHHIGSTSAV